MASQDHRPPEPPDFAAMDAAADADLPDLRGARPDRPMSRRDAQAGHGRVLLQLSARGVVHQPTAYGRRCLTAAIQDAGGLHPAIEQAIAAGRGTTATPSHAEVDEDGCRREVRGQGAEDAPDLDAIREAEAAEYHEGLAELADVPDTAGEPDTNAAGEVVYFDRRVYPPRTHVVSHGVREAERQAALEAQAAHAHAEQRGAA